MGRRGRAVYSTRREYSSFYPARRAATQMEEHVLHVVDFASLVRPTPVVRKKFRYCTLLSLAEYLLTEVELIPVLHLGALSK
jgi:hypothetical protein